MNRRDFIKTTFAPPGEDVKGHYSGSILSKAKCCFGTGAGGFMLMTRPLSGLMGIWGRLAQGSDGKAADRRNPGLV